MKNFVTTLGPSLGANLSMQIADDENKKVAARTAGNFPGLESNKSSHGNSPPPTTAQNPLIHSPKL